MTTRASFRSSSGTKKPTTCMFGVPWSAHMQGCLWCHAEADRLCAQFAADVASGKCDAEGFTPKDRRAQAKRQQAA